MRYLMPLNITVLIIANRQANKWWCQYSKCRSKALFLLTITFSTLIPAHNQTHTHTTYCARVKERISYSFSVFLPNLFYLPWHRVLFTLLQKCLSVVPTAVYGFTLFRSIIINWRYLWLQWTKELKQPNINITITNTCVCSVFSSGHFWVWNIVTPTLEWLPIWINNKTVSCFMHYIVLMILNSSL